MNLRAAIRGRSTSGSTFRARRSVAAYIDVDGIIYRSQLSSRPSVGSRIDVEGFAVVVVGCKDVAGGGVIVHATRAK